MDDDRLARVTEGQRECLRMVLSHMSSKYIGRALGISSHTVDQRLKQAMRTLGASSRVEAARRLAALEGAGAYQSLAHQSPDIDEGRNGAALPVPDRGNGEKKDVFWSRVRWIGIAAVVAAIGIAALFSALNELSEFTR